jgi:hypothetical protein
MVGILSAHAGNDCPFHTNYENSAQTNQYRSVAIVTIKLKGTQRISLNISPPHLKQQLHHNHNDTHLSMRGGHIEELGYLLLIIHSDYFRPVSK